MREFNPRSSNRLTIAKRELASLSSEKTIVLAILIQLFIAAFSSFLVVGLVSLYDPGAVSEDVSVSVGVTGDATERLVDAADDAPAVSLTRYDSAEAARDDFERGRIGAVLDASDRPGGGTHVTATVPESGFRSTFVVIQVREMLQELERSERTRLEPRLVNAPVSPPDEANTSPYFGFTYTVLIPLLMFLPVFISGSIAVDSITEELERGTLELLRVTPLSLREIIDGKLAAMALLAPLQAGAWLLLLSLDGTAIANPLPVLAVVVAFSVVVTTVGAVIALRFGDRERAQFVYSMAVLLLFSATYLLPENPANTVAKLVIGSPGVETVAMVAAYPVAAAVVYAAGWRLIPRVHRRLA